MSHEVEQMMYRGDVPWHGLGNPIPQDKSLSVEEAVVAGGCDFEVGLLPLSVSVDPEDFVGQEDADVLSGMRVPAQCTYRKTDNRILGVVGPNYHVLQNETAFEFFQPYLDSGEAAFETAGSLSNGAKIWALAKLNRDPIVVAENDEVEKFLLLSNSHDGTMAVRVGFTPIRVVCANTLAAATQNGASQLLRIRHTGSMEGNLEKVRDLINVANASFDATGEQYKYLASRGINKTDLERYVRIVMNKPEPSPGKKTPPQTQTMLSDIFQRFEIGRGSDVSSVKGTYWNAYNAVTEYLNYEYGRTQNSRLKSLWFGESANRNLKALKTAVDMADKYGHALAA